MKTIGAVNVTSDFRGNYFYVGRAVVSMAFDITEIFKKKDALLLGRRLIVLFGRTSKDNVWIVDFCNPLSPKFGLERLNIILGEEDSNPEIPRLKSFCYCLGIESRELMKSITLLRDENLR